MGDRTRLPTGHQIMSISLIRGNNADVHERKWPTSIQVLLYMYSQIMIYKPDIEGAPALAATSRAHRTMFNDFVQTTVIFCI